MIIQFKVIQTVFFGKETAENKIVTKIRFIYYNIIKTLRGLYEKNFIRDFIIFYDSEFVL